MLRKVWLHGSLAERITKEPISIDADTPAILISGLKCNFPQFENELRKNKNIAFVRTDADGKPISVSEETWDMTLGKSTDIHIVPALEGGGFEIAALFTWEGVASAALAMLKNVAISWVLGSIAQKVAPKPDTSINQKGPVDQRPSFLFNGPVNVTAPGYPVPLVYGQHRVGSVVISAGATSEQI